MSQHLATRLLAWVLASLPPERLRNRYIRFCRAHSTAQYTTYRQAVPCHDVCSNSVPLSVYTVHSDGVNLAESVSLLSVISPRYYKRITLNVCANESCDVRRAAKFSYKSMKFWLQITHKNLKNMYTNYLRIIVLINGKPVKSIQNMTSSMVMVIKHRRVTAESMDSDGVFATCITHVMEASCDTATAAAAARTN